MGKLSGPDECETTAPSKHVRKETTAVIGRIDLPPNPFPVRCSSLEKLNDDDSFARGDARDREAARRRAGGSAVNSERDAASRIAAHEQRQDFSCCQPVTEVGGDFLDYFELTDGCFGLYLGDVSGKGLPAAMYAALAVGTLRGVHQTGLCPSQVLSTLNRRLMLRGTPRRHAAVQYASFDPRTRMMRIAGAGMPGPFHLSPKGCRGE
jgi:hypothetical protein